MILLSDYCEKYNYSKASVSVQINNGNMNPRYIKRITKKGAKRASFVMINESEIAKDFDDYKKLKELIFNLYLIFEDYTKKINGHTAESIGDGDSEMTQCILSKNSKDSNSLMQYMRRMFDIEEQVSYNVRVTENMSIILSKLLTWFDKVAYLYERNIERHKRMSRADLINKILDNRIDRQCNPSFERNKLEHRS